MSIDFSLSSEDQAMLTIEDGVVVPISVLTKEARKKFDLRDETGRSIPVLGRDQNGELAHIALMNAVVDALPEESPSEVYEMLAADLRQIVFGAPSEASDALGFFMGSAEAGDRWRAAVVGDEVCQALLDVLWANYVLFAVLQPDGGNRRVLKYSYADDFDVSLPRDPWRERLMPRELFGRVWEPDRRYFAVECPGAWRSASFHAEVAVPEELRVNLGLLYDFAADKALSEMQEDVNRLSVYASSGIESEHAPRVLLEVSAQRAGRPFQAAVTSSVVAVLLWWGVMSGLDAKNPGAAVSILLAGAALFTGLSATRGEHRLVTVIFAASRRWLGLTALAALVGSASLAMEYPKAHPVAIWRGCAIVASVAAARLLWSAIRAPS